MRLGSNSRFHFGSGARWAKYPDSLSSDGNKSLIKPYISPFLNAAADQLFVSGKVKNTTLSYHCMTASEQSGDSSLEKWSSWSRDVKYRRVPVQHFMHIKSIFWAHQLHSSGSEPQLSGSSSEKWGVEVSCYFKVSGQSISINNLHFISSHILIIQDTKRQSVCPPDAHTGLRLALCELSESGTWSAEDTILIRAYSSPRTWMSWVGWAESG